MSAMTSGWVPGPTKPVVDASALHLWRGSLVASAGVVQECRTWLNTSEQSRADRFVTDDLGARFTLGRALLRSVLGRYLRCDPSDVTFEYGEQGKPRLAESSHPIEFNLTHSADVVVLGVTSHAAIGIDVEHRRASRDLDGIARRYFSATEVEVYERFEGSERVDAFYRCWARKEAYLKAKGGGLSAPLDRFVVTLTPEAELVSSDLDESTHCGWWMHRFDPGGGCEGALCVEGCEVRVSQWEWATENLAT